jgi:hypothetical protein
MVPLRRFVVTAQRPGGTAHHIGVLLLLLLLLLLLPLLDPIFLVSPLTRLHTPCV